MLSAAYLGSSCGLAGAQSLPTNPSIVSGGVNVTTPSATKMVVTQSTPTGIVNWSTFSIGQGNQVSFQNGSGATLNRVTGNVPSSINGLLTATGSVYLINPAGIAVGPNGIIKTGGSFVGSTLDISDESFHAGGSLTFGGGSSASVVNLGKIGSSRGDVVLIAQNVENAGSIRAGKGTAALASGTEVTIRDQAMSDGKIAVSLPAHGGSVRNGGAIRAANAELRANGGNVYALGLNTRSVIKASGVANRGGRVFLTATGGDVVVSSRVSAKKSRTASRKSPKDGGQIVITGNNVTLAAGAKLDASGQTGGTILIGGDRQGGKNSAQNFSDFQIVNAETTTVAAGATVNADGTTGNGGNIVVWSEQTTSFAGAISARGGATAGNGGFAEVSGKRSLSYTGTADLRAPAGDTGTLLLDPFDMTIDSSAASTIATNLGTANVTVQTNAGSASGPGTQNASGSGDITINSAIDWSSANTLTLDAYRGININANLTASGAGKVVITTNNGGSGGDYNFASGSSLKFTGTEGSGQALTINGNSYSLVYTRAELAAIGADATSMGQRYALAKDIDLSGSDFVTLGYRAFPSSSIAFTGVLSGLGNNIANFTQTNQAGYSALFGLTEAATLRDFSMTNVSLTHDGTGAIPTYVGAVVGYADNNNPGTTGTTLKNISVAGNISVNHGHSQTLIGGAIGVLEEYGTATNVRSSINVTQTGTDVSQTVSVGGLIGTNDGTITQSYSTGAVSGTRTVGGFAGINAGTITQSYSTGSVTLDNPTATAGAADNINGSLALFAGGFAGVNGSNSTARFPGVISQSYSTGAVNLNAGSNRPGTLNISSAAGSFVGTNTRRFDFDPSINGGTITEVYATGYVGGNATQTGAIVGKNESSFSGGTAARNGTVTNAYWDTLTTGQTTITGDVGASTSGGMTTAAIQGTLPSGFNTAQSDVWETGTGLYPYFGWRYPTAPQAISGRAYSDSGATALKGGAVSVAVSGTDIGRASTGANGYYYLLEPAGTIPSSGAPSVGYINGGNGGARLATLSGTTTNFDIWGATLIAPTSASSLSAALAISPPVENATLIANATNGNATATAAVTGLSKYGYVAADGFTIDQTINLTGGDGLYVKTLAGDVTLAGPVTIADGGLTLDAFHSVNINSNIVVSGAGRVTIATNDGDSGGDYNFANGTSLKFTGASGSGQALTINGDDYNLIYTIGELQALNTDTTTLARKYAIARDVDASGLADFDSIGSASNVNFTGVLTGLNNTVDRLTSTGATNDMAGLFGWNFAGTLRDLKLTNVTIGGSALQAGGAVAQMAATGSAVVQNVSVVGGTVSARTLAGGVVGENGSSGTISRASAIDVSVSESFSSMSNYRAAGGLVGRNLGAITQSYATGSVSAMKQAGGLVGINYGTISQSYATGAVTLSPIAGAVSGDGVGAGGFVGVNVVNPSASAATITQSYATGSVTLNNANSTSVPIGSFAGANGGSITEAYGTGYLSIASGTGTIGGFSGANTAVNAASQTKTGTLTNTYYDTLTTGQTAQGGGLTTSALQGTLPSGFNTVQADVWSTGSGRYPYLGWRFASAPDVVSGIAYTDRLADGGTVLKGSGVSLLVGGVSATNATTGANGYYYFFADAGTVSGASGVLAALTGTIKGNAFTDTAVSGTISGLDIYGGYLRLASSSTNYSTIVGNLSTALGSNIGSDYLFTTAAGPTISLKSNTSLVIESSASDLTVDQSITATGTGTVTLSADDMTLLSAVATAGPTVRLMPVTAGRGITLGGSAGGTLNLSAAELDQITATTLEIGNSSAGAGTFAGSIGPGNITNLKLVTASNISQSAGTLTVNGLSATGTSVTLVNANAIGTAAVSATGAVNLVNAGALTIGSVAGVDGITAGGTVTIHTGGDLTLASTTGAVSAAGAGDALQLITGGTFTNNMGSSALSITGGGGRWLVWSQDPASDTKGSLAYGFKQYNATYGLTTPADSTLNGFLYAVAPSVTATFAGAVSKVYDQTANAAGLTASNFNVAGAIDGDTVNISNTGGSFSQSDVGTGLTVSATGLSVASATDGAAAVYGYQISSSTASTTNGEITARPLTVTATKTYDQSATFSLAQIGLSGALSGDNVTLTGGSAAVSSANANTYNSFATNTLTVSNSNYTVSGAGVTVAATINKAPLSLTAAKTYDGLASFTTGQITLGGIISGDTVTLTGGTATVSSRNAGGYNSFASNMLTVSNSNYAVTGAGVTESAAIGKASLTIAAATNSKTYDGTDSAAAAPTVSGLQTGDSVTGLVQTYDNKNAGSGKTLSVSNYTVNDGNGGNNYNVTAVTDTTGSIGKATLTLTAVADTKGYDGTISSSATPIIGNLQTGDSVTGLSQTFDTKDVGTGKTLTVAGYTVSDGNNGDNYNVSTVANGAGAITAKAVTATADAQSKTQGLPDPVFTYRITAGALAPGDIFTGLLARDPGDAAGTYLIKQGSLALSANYILTYVGANLTINAAAPDNVFGSFTTPLGPSNGLANPFNMNAGNLPDSISVGDNNGGTDNTPLFCAVGDACSQMPFQNNLHFGQWIHFAGSQ